MEPGVVRGLAKQWVMLSGLGQMEGLRHRGHSGSPRSRHAVSCHLQGVWQVTDTETWPPHPSSPPSTREGVPRSKHARSQSSLAGAPRSQGSPPAQHRDCPRKSSKDVSQGGTALSSGRAAHVTEGGVATDVCTGTGSPVWGAVAVRSPLSSWGN